MKPWHGNIWLGLFLALATPRCPAADVTLETRSLRLVVDEDGIVKSLAAKPSGMEYAWTSQPCPIATVYRGGRPFPTSHVDFVENQAPTYRGGESFSASRAARNGNQLRVEFAEANAKATYEVKTNRDYLALTLLAMEGEPVDRIDLLRVRIKKLPYLGSWINVAYDDDFGICLCAGNVRTNAGMNRHEEYVEMRAMAERGVALEGATAVLFGCPNPQERFLDVMEIVERDFRMPAGARHRRSPIQRYSYLWCSPTPDDVGEYIQLAKRAGFRMVLFSYNAFTRGAGHFLWNERYPNGMADLKKVTDAVRNAGLKLGLHIHYCKAHKSDPYVTPVPDDRLHTTRLFTFAADVDGETTTIVVNENPAGCTLDNGRRILKAGKELIAYTNYTTAPPFLFTGCERGHLNTTAASHQARTQVGLLDVDSWNIFIRFDQNTDIQDEAARRIADIFNQTGPYDMVYFDGAEDVHAPFWYHVANAQHRVYRLFQTEPPVCEAASNSHFSWHMMSRSNAYDVPSRHIKAFTYYVPYRTAPVRAVDFSRIEFGWIFGLYEFVGPDVLEYVLSRAAAWDCPFSIRISPAQVAAHPRGDDCLDVIRVWEDARIDHGLTESQRKMLRTLDPEQHQYVKVWDAVSKKGLVERWSTAKLADQEHHLFINDRGEPELVPIDEISDVAGGFFKAYRFRRVTRPTDTYILIWAVKGKADLLLPVAADRVRAMRPFGTRRPVRTEGDKAAVSVGRRTYLVLSGMGVDRAEQVLERAEISKAGAMD